MGAYLSSPETIKHSEDSEFVSLRYGSSSMQGWRPSQEDAHNCIPDYDIKSSLFAVYDGHGGAEVAQYASQELPKFLKNNSHYKDGSIKIALEKVFMDFDEHLATKDVRLILKKMAGMDDDPSPEHNEEDEEALLIEESNMPIDQVLKRYGCGNKSTNSFQSPIVRAKTVSVNKEASDSSSKLETSSDLSSHNLNDVTSSNMTESTQRNKSSAPCSSELVCSSTSTSSPSKGTKDNSDSSTNSNNSSSKTIVSLAQSTSDQSTSIPVNSGVGSSTDPTSSSSTTSDSTEAGSSSGSSKPNYSRLLDDGEEEDDEDEQTSEEEDSDEWHTDDSDDSDDDLITEYKKNVGSPEDEEDDDDEVDGMSCGDDPGMDSGCTAVLALIKDKQLYVANAGDSRCVLCHNGKAVDMSIDHKPEDTIESSRISAAGGKISLDGRVNGGLNLSRALGDHVYKSNADVSPEAQMITAFPDVQSRELDEKDEFMVLACDGIWNVMTSQEVVSFIRDRMLNEELKLSSIIEELFDFCIAPDTTGDGTGCDNMTCIIVEFQNNQAVSRTRKLSQSEMNGDKSESKRQKLETH